MGGRRGGKADGFGARWSMRGAEWSPWWGGWSDQGIQGERMRVLSSERTAKLAHSFSGYPRLGISHKVTQQTRWLVLICCV